MRPLKPKNSFSCFTHGFTCEFELELHTHSPITSHSHTTTGALRFPAAFAYLFEIKRVYGCLSTDHYPKAAYITLNLASEDHHG
jgi:hypothetical protein